jgi:hypothetical protein
LSETGHVHAAAAAGLCCGGSGQATEQVSLLGRSVLAAPTRLL